MPEITHEEVDQVAGAANLNLSNLLKNLGGLVDTGTAKEIQDLQVEKNKAIVTSLEADGLKIVPNSEKKEEKPADKPAEEKPTETPAEKPAGSTEEKPIEDEKPNILGLKIGKKATAAKPTLTIEKAEDILPTVKAKYGMDLKDIKDLPKFFESVDKFRADSQKLTEVEKERDQFKGFFEGMSPELLAINTAFYEGRDYTELTKKAVFDYNKEADKQDVKTLVTHYYKDKFTEDQLATIGTEETDPTVAIAIESSKDKYNIEKKAKQDQILAYDNQAKEQLKKFTASVDSSISNLEKSFPGIAPDTKVKVKSIMSGGIKKIAEILCNPDGSFKPNAANRLVLALDGEEVIIPELMSAAERYAETRVNEEFAQRGDGKRQRENGGGASSDGISPEAKKVLEEIEKMGSKARF
jgi:hypothetical protein